MVRKIIAVIILFTFTCASIHSPAYAASSLPFMPSPGTMVRLSSEFTPANLKGIVIHPENALKFDFIVDRGQTNLTYEEKKQEYAKLIKYFLASLAIPDEDQWVNLSPYEKDRIIKDDFGKTEMGRDLLAQDYMLKQITASLIYPEDSLGQQFWTKVYAQAQKQYGTTNIPVNTFNKVWILPDSAELYEKGNAVFLIKSHLKVMLEEDYLAIKKHQGQSGDMFPAQRGTCPQAGCLASNPMNVQAPQGENQTHTIASQIVREIVLPQLEGEVNEGKNFASLRQAYSGMILAAWYKRALKESLLGKIYVNQSRVHGVDQDPKTNEIIYQQYLKAYRKGVFNFIKEEIDQYSNESIPRKYFSGGVVGAAKFSDFAQMVPEAIGDPAMGAILKGNTDIVRSNLLEESEFKADAAMLTRRRILTGAAVTGAAAFAAGNLLPEYQGKGGEIELLSDNFVPSKKNLLFMIGAEDDNPHQTVIDIYRLAKGSYNVFIYKYDYLNPFEDLADDFLEKIKETRKKYNIQDDMTVIPYSYGAVIFRAAVLNDENGNLFKNSLVIQLAPVAGGAQDSETWAQYFHDPSWFYMAMKGTWVKRNEVHIARALNPYDVNQKDLYSDENTAEFNRRIKSSFTLIAGIDDESLANSKDKRILRMFQNGVGANYEIIKDGVHENLPNDPNALKKLRQLLNLSDSAMTSQPDTSFKGQAADDLSRFFDIHFNLKSFKKYDVEPGDFVPEFLKGARSINETLLKIYESNRKNNPYFIDPGYDVFFKEVKIELIALWLSIKYDLSTNTEEFIQRYLQGDLDTEKHMGNVTLVIHSWIVWQSFRNDGKTILQARGILKQAVAMMGQDAAMTSDESSRLAKQYLSLLDLVEQAKDIREPYQSFFRRLSGFELSKLFIRNKTVNEFFGQHAIANNRKNIQKSELDDFSGFLYDNDGDVWLVTNKSTNRDGIWYGNKFVMNVRLSRTRSGGRNYSIGGGLFGFLDGGFMEAALGYGLGGLIGEDEVIHTRLSIDAGWMDPRKLGYHLFSTNHIRGFISRKDMQAIAEAATAEAASSQNGPVMTSNGQELTKQAIDVLQAFLGSSVDGGKIIIQTSHLNEPMLTFYLNGLKLNMGWSHGILAGNAIVTPKDPRDFDNVFKAWVTRKLEKVQKSGFDGLEFDLAMKADNALVAAHSPEDPLGGIDFDAAQLHMQIKRDGNGVPLPLARQDWENIHIDGLVPVILSITPAAQSSLFSELVAQQ